MKPLLLTTLSLGQKAAKTVKPIGFSLVESVTKRKPTDMIGKILIPGELKKKSHKELIDSFLAEWLTDKQLEMSGQWFREMLQAFQTELMLHSGLNNGFMDKLHLDPWQLIRKTGAQPKSKLSLPLVTEPKKFKRAVVELEEVGGDLASEAKLIRVDEITNTETQPDIDCSFKGVPYLPPAENLFEGGV